MGGYWEHVYVWSASLFGLESSTMEELSNLKHTSPVSASPTVGYQGFKDVLGSVFSLLFRRKLVVPVAFGFSHVTIS